MIDLSLVSSSAGSTCTFWVSFLDAFILLLFFFLEMHLFSSVFLGVDGGGVFSFSFFPFRLWVILRFYPFPCGLFEVSFPLLVLGCDVGVGLWMVVISSHQVQLVVGVLLYLGLMGIFRGDVVSGMRVKHGVF